MRGACTATCRAWPPGAERGPLEVEDRPRQTRWADVHRVADGGARKLRLPARQLPGAGAADRRGDAVHRQQQWQADGVREVPAAERLVQQRDHPSRAARSDRLRAADRNPQGRAAEQGGMVRAVLDDARSRAGAGYRPAALPEGRLHAARQAGRRKRIACTIRRCSGGTDCTFSRCRGFHRCTIWRCCPGYCRAIACTIWRCVSRNTICPGSGEGHGARYRPGSSPNACGTSAGVGAARVTRAPKRARVREPTAGTPEARPGQRRRARTESAEETQWHGACKPIRPSGRAAVA